MNAPLFRQLSREEFNKLSLEERMAYMQALMHELAAKLEETRHQVEETKKLVRESSAPV
ncbi:MAG TPA: hypothetical protein VFJ70_01705 [Burkholderiales bacterium]|nr:hypothetical protein [Burkholderiales bacterium]